MTDRNIETALLRKCPAVRYHAESVHLQAVIVVEAKGFMRDNSLIQLESTIQQALPGPRMAGIQDRHVVLFSHLIDCRKEAGKVLFRIDVFFPVGRQKDVFTFL